MGELSSREIATGLWIGISLLWGLTRADTRAAGHAFLNAFLDKKIVTLFASFYAYVILVVVLLRYVSLWDSGEIKNTIIWATTAGITALMRTSSIADDAHFFRKAALDNLKVGVVIEFITSVYTFPIFVELFLVPLGTSIALMAVIAERKEEHRAIAMLLNGALALYAIFLIAHGVYRAFTDFGNFATWQTFEDFYTPLLLSFSTLPFLYVVSFYVAYENAFVRLGIAIKDREVLRYTKKRALTAFATDLELLRRWSRSAIASELSDEISVDDSIREYQAIKEREKHPPIVLAADGWSPYVAAKFLEDKGLGTGDYHPFFGGWFATSPYVNVDADLIASKVMYSVEGDTLAAKRLVLTLDVLSSKSGGAAADEMFFAFADALLRKSVNNQVAEELSGTLRTANSHDILVFGKRIRLSHKEWGGSATGAYSRELVIELATPPLSSS